MSSNIITISGSTPEIDNDLARDDIIINTPWCFDIGKINIRFDIWQGDMDKNVPLNQGKYQASYSFIRAYILWKKKVIWAYSTSGEIFLPNW